MFWNILTHVAVAIGYSLFFYLSKVLKDQAEPFNWQKLITTAIVGLVVGIGFMLKGIEINLSNISDGILGASAIWIVLIDKILAIIVKLFQRKK